jgi:predicted amidophosphoribosyltransferase
VAPVFKDTNFGDGQEIYSYGSYKPYWIHKEEGGDSSTYPEHSGKVLDVKDGYPRGINHFAALLEKDLGDDFAIAVVPSHDPEKRDSGLKSLAAELAKVGRRRTDASECLVRTKKIDKLAHGGDRSIEVHLNSVEIAKPELIKGRDALLIDDVMKTGNSLRACAQLLLKAGAKSVRCITLGATG